MRTQLRGINAKTVLCPPLCLDQSLRVSRGLRTWTDSCIALLAQDLCMVGLSFWRPTMDTETIRDALSALSDEAPELTDRKRKYCRQME